MSEFRVDVPPYEDMTTDQKKIYDTVVAYMGGPIGPRIVLLTVPNIGAKWAELLATIQESDLPRKLWELSILVVARYWNSQFEFWAHEEKAIKEGLSTDVIEAIKYRKQPKFEHTDEEIAYQYCYELMYNKNVSEESYEALKTLIGQQQLIEFTVLMGHYSSVAMTLVAHRVPLPDNVSPPLPQLEN